MKHLIEIAACAAGFISTTVAVLAWLDARQLNQDTIFVTALNTRINTCTSLSNYHRGLGSSQQLATDKRILVSSTEVRSEREADLARALNLCLIEFKSIEQVKLCVGEVNAREDHLVHDMIELGINGDPPKGANILAC